MATALATYVSNKNAFCAIFGSKRIEMPRKNMEPVKRLKRAMIIFNLLEGDLSPENLHCDGEISAAAARKKAKSLNAAWKQLEGIIGGSYDSIDEREF